MGLSPEVRIVVLHPTAETVAQDVAAMAAATDTPWSYQDLLSIESRILEATQGPLCIDPSPEVARRANADSWRRYSCGNVAPPGSAHSGLLAVPPPGVPLAAAPQGASSCAAMGGSQKEGPCPAWTKRGGGGGGGRGGEEQGEGGGSVWHEGGLGVAEGEGEGEDADWDFFIEEDEEEEQGIVNLKPHDPCSPPPGP